MHYWVPIAGISYLIYLNPCIFVCFYRVVVEYFPAAIPLLGIADLIGKFGF